jgi:hypothetical protein
MKRTEVSMGAQVLGCGHASQLFKVEYLEDTPQVHIHYLTEDEEVERDGFGKIEFVCHGCGAAMLLVYDANISRRSSLAIRNRFRADHMKCPDLGYEKICPDYRRTSKVVDVRRKLKRALAQRVA